MPCFACFVPNMHTFPIIYQSKFFYGIDPDVLMNVRKYFIIVLIWAAWVLFNFYLIKKLIFILQKNNGFQSRALLKMPHSSPSIEDFCLGIQN